MPTPLISLTNVSKSFADHQVLFDINLDIHNGEFITLLGPSGCGKTTILKMISGFEQPDTGTINLAGRDVASIQPEQRRVNTVFQSYALFPHLTVFDNVAFGLRCKHVPEEEVATRVEEVLALVQLERFAGRKPHQLSGGQQQRVAIARAVVNKPLVLLLDEPLSALDYRLRKSMQIQLKHWQRELGITFVFVTHDQEEALSMSDRVVVMQDGHIQQLGTPREVYEEPKTLAVAEFIGEANIFTVPVEAINDKQFTVTIEEHKFDIDASIDVKPEQRVHIVLRPEDIEVWGQAEVSSKDRNAMLPAVVEEVIYKGSTVDLILTLASGKKIAASEFFNEDDENLDYEIGEKVWVQWFAGWEVVILA